MINRMNRRHLASLFVFAALAACGGEESSDVACELAYWDGQVASCLPDGWHVVDRTQLDQRGLPSEVFVAFQSDASVSGQYPTVTVTREPLVDDVTSTAYSEASVESVKALPGYEQIDERPTAVDGQEVSLHIFSAQPRSEEPRARFYQLSMAKERQGYTFTAAVPLAVDEKIENEILLIMSNASLSAPPEEADAE